jgi:dCTP deaminase
VSVLVDTQILALGEAGVVSPFDPENVNPSSLDIRLGHSVAEIVPSGHVVRPTSKLFYATGRSVVDPYFPDSFVTSSQDIEHELILRSGEFIIAEMYERVRFPTYVSGRLYGKSSLLRLGLDITISWIDPGFAGTIVLEIKNSSTNDIILRPKMKIGQIVFESHAECLSPYGSLPKHRYQHQSGAQGSKGI